MKNLYGLLLLFLFVSCKTDEIVESTQKIKEEINCTIEHVSIPLTSEQKETLANFLNDNKTRMTMPVYFKEEVMFWSGDALAVLNFWASWCGPCKMYAPIFENVSNKYVNECFFLKADVDVAVELGSAYNVKSLPTTLFIKHGDVCAQATGILWESTLTALVEQYK